MEQTQEQIVEEFAIFDDWLDKYNYLIELAATLPMIDPAHRTEQYVISGCQSRVWIDASFDGERLHFTADSDAIITKGIIALLIRVMDSRTP
ncbi:MAG: SufE family protein, partial [Mucinivorans sp.]